MIYAHVIAAHRFIITYTENRSAIEAQNILLRKEIHAITSAAIQTTLLTFVDLYLVCYDCKIIHYIFESIDNIW